MKAEMAAALVAKDTVIRKGSHWRSDEDAKTRRAMGVVISYQVNALRLGPRQISHKSDQPRVLLQHRLF
jgi:hypothetical protein